MNSSQLWSKLTKAQSSHPSTTLHPYFKEITFTSQTTHKLVSHSKTFITNISSSKQLLSYHKIKDYKKFILSKLVWYSLLINCVGFKLLKKPSKTLLNKTMKNGFKIKENHQNSKDIENFGNLLHLLSWTRKLRLKSSTRDQQSMFFSCLLVWEHTLRKLMWLHWRLISLV